MKSPIKHIEENGFIVPRYIAASAAGFVVGTIVLLILTEKIHLYYLYSAVIGAFASIITDFLLNDNWTFAKRKKEDWMRTTLTRRFLKYLSSKTVGLVIALSILAIGTQVFGIYYLISNMIGITVSFLWNYAVSNLWVWSRKRAD